MLNSLFSLQPPLPSKKCRSHDRNKLARGTGHTFKGSRILGKINREDGSLYGLKQKEWRIDGFTYTQTKALWRNPGPCCLVNTKLVFSTTWTPRETQRQFRKAPLSWEDLQKILLVCISAAPDAEFWPRLQLPQTFTEMRICTGLQLKFPNALQAPK